MLKRGGTCVVALWLAFVCLTGQTAACEFDLCASTAYGNILTNTINDVREVHGYSFDASAGDVIKVKATRNNGNFAPRIDIFNNSGISIAASGSGGPRVEIGPLLISSTESYKIVLQDVNTTGIGDYTLSVQSINNSSDRKGIDYDDILLDTLFTYTDVNIYQFDAEAGEPIVLQVVSLDFAVQPEVYLYDWEAKLLSHSIAGIGENIASILNYTLPYTNRYYIAAEGGLGTDVGEILILLQRLITDADDNEDPLPQAFALHQNSPNPFNPSTSISFTLPRSSQVQLDIYDILGRRILRLADDIYPAGPHKIAWDGRRFDGQPVASGMYFYRLTTPEFTSTRKMLLTK